MPSRSERKGRGKTVVLVRRTLRMHDNPLLGVEGCFCFLLDRKPESRVEEERVDSMTWSLPQYSLLTNLLRLHSSDMEREGRELNVLEGKMEEVLDCLSKEFDRIVMDEVADPAYDGMEEEARKRFGKVELVSTCTLVEWTSPENKEYLERSTSKAFARTKGIKERAVAQRREEFTSSPLPNVPLPSSLLRFKADLPSLPCPYLSRFGKLKSFDSSVLREAEGRARVMRKEGWRKPKTARNFGVGERGCEERENASQLSPLLSLGALSPLLFFNMMYGKRRDGVPEVGSGADQILFREAWYAHAFSDSEREGFWSDERGWWDPHSKYSPDKVGKGWNKKWKSAPKKVREWAWHSMREEWEDANESMRLLLETGWIHHLRRHLVADVLCRGELNQSFLYGERWFRRTLLDHDAALNRANWMWLSAVAFSTKQSYAHYKPSDYITRGSKKVCKRV